MTRRPLGNTKRKPVYDPDQLVLADVHRTMALVPTYMRIRAFACWDEQTLIRNYPELIKLNYRTSAAGMAMCIAGLHPQAIDYIRQAPVLAMANWTILEFENLRFLIQQSSKLPKLSAIMGAAELPGPLRKIDAKAQLSIRAVELLKLVNPSTLAQNIPVGSARQSIWGHQIDHWAVRIGFNHPEWIVRHAGEITLDEFDYLASGDCEFNDRWTLQRVRAASADWHNNIWQRELDGADPDQLADYGNWPDRVQIRQLEVVALRTPRSLHEEGQAMRHCVATYIKPVLNGSVRIYSIRRDGKRLATASFISRSVHQMKGVVNSSPTVEVEQVVRDFLDQLPLLKGMSRLTPTRSRSESASRDRTHPPGEPAT